MGYRISKGLRVSGQRSIQSAAARCTHRVAPVWFAVAVACLNVLSGISCGVLSPGAQPHPSAPRSGSTSLENVETMAWHDGASLWLGNRDAAWRLDITNGDVEVFDGIGCTQLLVTRNRESVWCSGTGGAYEFNGESWHEFDLEAYQIAEGDEGTLWAGTRQGLSRYDAREYRWVPVLAAPKIASHFIFSDGPGIHVSSVAADGAVWFYSFSEPYVGTTRWTDSSSQTWQPVGKWSVAQPKLEARNGEIWAVGDESLVARWDGRSWEIWQPFRLKPSVQDLIEAQDGSIWALAVADGVGRWDGQTWSVWSRDEAFLRECPGAAAGRNCFSPDPNTEYLPTDGLGRPGSGQSRLSLTAILETADGNIWVGTAGEGISRWDGRRWRNYSMVEGLRSEAIAVLSESPDGTLWAGTYGEGISFYDLNNDRWQPYPGM